MSLSAQSQQPQQQDRSCNTCLVSVILQIRIVLLSSCLPSLYFSAFFSTKTSERSLLPSKCYTVHLQWLVTQGSTICARCQQHEHLVFMGSAVKARQQIVLRDQLCSSQSFTSRLLGRADLPAARHRNTISLITQKPSSTQRELLYRPYENILIKTAWKCLLLIWKGKNAGNMQKTWHANVWHPKHSLAAVGDSG